MKKKVWNGIIIGIAVLMCSVVLIMVLQKVLWQPESKNNENKVASKEKDETNVNIPVTIDGEVMPYSDIISEIGEKFTIEPFEVQVQDIYATKGPIDSDAAYYAKNDFSHVLPVEFGENNEILNEYSYLVCPVEITNISDTEQELYINSFTYILLTDEKDDIDYESRSLGELLGYKTSKDAYERNKSYARVIFQSGEKKQYNLVFIEKDDVLTGFDLYIRYSMDGCFDPRYAEGVRFIKADLK